MTQEARARSSICCERALAAIGPEVSGPGSTGYLTLENGIGARAPRTQEVIPRYKDVMRGKLDRLLQAWQRK